MTIHALLSLLIASPAPAEAPYVPDPSAIRSTMKSLEPEYKTTKELLLMQNEKRAAFAFKKLAAFCTSLKRMEARLKAIITLQVLLIPVAGKLKSYLQKLIPFFLILHICDHNKT
jgi:hypothetical protein